MRKDKRRQQIVDEADAILQLGGWEGLTTQSLARAVGIMESSLYRYFPSKQAILLAVLHRANRRFHERAAKAKQQPTATEELKFLLDGSLAGGEQRRDVGFSVLGEALRQDNRGVLRTAYEKMVKAHNAYIKEALARGVAGGEFEPDLDVEGLAWDLHALLLGATVLWKFKTLEGSLSERQQTLWHVLAEGIRRKT